MSDSIKKYYELVEEGKIKPNCETAKGLKPSISYKMKILQDYQKSQHSSESDTSMSTYFVSKFLDWLSDEYNLIKRNHKL